MQLKEGPVSEIMLQLMRGFLYNSLQFLQAKVIYFVLLGICVVHSFIQMNILPVHHKIVKYESVVA